MFKLLCQNPTEFKVIFIWQTDSNKIKMQLELFKSWSTLSIIQREQLEPRERKASHLQQPRGPVDVSRLLSVSEASVGSVDMEDTSLTDEDEDG